MAIVNFLTMYWEAIVAICALVVSFVAVTISWKGLGIQQIHNQTSLRPIIFIEPYDYENRILIKIKNEGLGPAIVKKVYVHNNLNMEKSSIFNWLPSVLPNNMNYREYWTRSKDFVLRAGSIDHMLEIPVDTNNTSQIEARENIRNILKDLTVYIDYEDVYKNTMPTYSRELFLFGREDHENSENKINIHESIQQAKEIGVWLHSKTNNIAVPNDKRTIMALALMQQALDVTDSIVILLENNLPGPAWALARPMHEGYVRGVWLLEHASDDSVDKFEDGKCPRFPELLKQIGDDPETGGAFITGMTELNLSSFHDLTHGGMEHVTRRYTESAIEPNYSKAENINLIKARNQYAILLTCFLLIMGKDSASMEELLQKREEWKDAL